MPYTIQCRGRVLGTTSLEFDEFVPGQHSGYLEPEDGAQHLLDAVAVGYPNLLTWLMRDTTLPNGASFASPKFLASGECQAIAEAVAARVHLVLSLQPRRWDRTAHDRYCAPGPRVLGHAMAGGGT